MGNKDLGGFINDRKFAKLNLFDYWLKRIPVEGGIIGNFVADSECFKVSLGAADFPAFA